MCTVMFGSETLGASLTPEFVARQQVDDLIARDAAGEFSENQDGFSGGKLRVWFDEACYGNGDPGYYYVRIGHWPPMTTAYSRPQLIVKKSKLRPDQVDFMERKCRETREEDK
ncbi:MAG: hypothetical protein MJ025_05105 [Victivallaceae bacterium]|nr:hypothetical protein [Victivallaceae bacterium]